MSHLRHSKGVSMSGLQQPDHSLSDDRSTIHKLTEASTS